MTGVKKIHLIAAVDENWAIGYKNELLFRIKADLQLNFKAKTLGQVVVMGRNTFESLPGKKPLKDRTNIVLSHSMPLVEQEDLIICRSVKELSEILRGYPHCKVFIAGGASIYSQLLPYCSIAYITKVIASVVADKHLLNLDRESGWKLVESGPEQVHDGNLRFFFTTYENRKPLPLP